MACTPLLLQFHCSLYGLPCAKRRARLSKRCRTLHSYDDSEDSQSCSFLLCRVCCCFDSPRPAAAVRCQPSCSISLLLIGWQYYCSPAPVLGCIANSGAHTRVPPTTR